MTTNCLVILGIFVTILIFAIQTWNSRQTIQTQEVVTTKENIQQTITPKTQNKNSQPSESEKK
jgi:predicted negative regulator of RcsB-dependent stress response